MATEISKIKAFEYLTIRLIEWFNESVDSSIDNDISTLKALKLLFFVSSVGTVKDSMGTLLDSPFNNFVAMPYGHVESDIYSAMKQGKIKNIKIDNSKTVIVNLGSILELSDEIKKQIDNAIETLKVANYKLINLSSFELVELSHRWFSWKKNYQIALKNNAFMSAIQVNEIKSEDKFYQL
ncbi:hypothetical protein B6A10_00440 [Flavobacterium sp. L1I52]|uniref:Antitoxin SocA-like Panacea domain-containing protein n=1 Tax=Flavobacterium pokkalii TaxID=1940408 RepID=A0ABR7UL92_9FLAO|nr:type II toxin-antitoxin system antitoxin SocA domain-containing protein [Flavobacterium pokkalii]MBD0723641.1 hypothetical protein [Flavobacterium pokkalii]